MLTKTQASQIADELIAQQQTLLNKRLGADTPRVSYIYRCAEMAKLPKREQAALLLRAQSIVQQEWLIHIVVLALTAAAPLTWWVLIGDFGATSRATPIFFLVAVAVAVLHTLQVRMVMRILAGHPTDTA